MNKEIISKQSLISVTKNSLALFLVKVIMPLSHLVVIILITRFLGVRDFGIFAIIFSFYGIFRNISIFGIDYFLVREIPRDLQKAGAYLGSSFLLGVILSVIAVFLMNFCLYINNYSFFVKITGLVLSLALLPDSFITYSEAVFIAFHKNKYIFFVVCLREILFVIFSAVAILVYKCLFFVIIGRFVVSILGFLVNLRIINKSFFKQIFSLDVNIFSSIFKVSLVMALIGIINSIFLATDVIVLSRIKGEIDVGLYSAAYKFVKLVAIFVDSIAITLLPIFSRLYKDSFKDFKKIVKTFFKYFIPLGICTVILVCFLSKGLIFLIFGKQFIDSSLILNILIWSILFRGSSLILGRILFAANMQNYDLLAHALASIANILLNIYFTLQWGYIGTAVATLISYGCLFFIQYYIFRNKLFKSLAQ